jgi:hypothetical protein
LRAASLFWAKRLNVLASSCLPEVVAFLLSSEGLGGAKVREVEGSPDVELEFAMLL